jgi:tetratricopeptide (TPR) repeat protein
MPAHNFRCNNQANCDVALRREVFEIEDGEEQKCPACKQKAVPYKEQAAVTPWRRVAIAVAVLAAVTAGAYATQNGRLKKFIAGYSTHRPSPNQPSITQSSNSLQGKESANSSIGRDPARAETKVYPCQLQPVRSVDVARLLQYLKQGMNYASQKRPELALNEFQQVLRIDPNFLGAEMNIGSAYLAEKQFSESETALNRELKLIGCLKQMNSEQLAGFAYMDEAPAFSDQNQTRAGMFRAHLDQAEAEVHYNLACLNALRGQRETALAELKKSLGTRLIAKRSLQTDPDLRGIRNTAEFKTLMSGYVQDAKQDTKSDL